MIYKMSFMYKMIASLYRYNMRGANKSISYFATLTNLLVILIFIVYIAIGFLGAKDMIGFWRTGSKGGDYLIGAFFVTPPYFLLWFLFPERKMKEQAALLTKKEYRYGLFCYVLSLLILFALLIIAATK